MPKLIKLMTCALSFTSLLACQAPFSSPNTTPDGFTLIERKQPASDAIGIGYAKYRLKNGLTVILHEDHSDPLVHVDMTYHVGSAREELGKSGFAHFFEHMMFQGSEHVADEQHFKMITEAGGTMNGSTTFDRTNYYQTVPANQLEKILWLEADRMGFLLPAVTQEKFEVQRATVKNERAQRVDNRPYGLLSERGAQALYPHNHPYSWPVIGYVEDLDSVDVNDLKAFFQRWYGPNNAVLTIGGDIDTVQTLRWIEQYFGEIPTGPAVTPSPKTLVSLSQSRYITLEDDVHLPLLQLSMPTVHVRHTDEAALDVLANILGSGKTSLFYKNLVQDGYAVQAQVNHPCRELACEFKLTALANPGKADNLAAIQTLFNDTLAEFEQRGVTEDDIRRTVARMKASTIFSLQSVEGKVSTLAYNEIISSTPDLVQADLDRYGDVTVQQVMAVYQRYVKNKPFVAVSVVPRGQALLAAKVANFDYQRPLADASLVNSPSGIDSEIKLVSGFDRSVIPAAGAAPQVKVPEFWRSAFPNNMQIIGHTTSETPTVQISIGLEGGPLLDSFENAGLASFTAQLMNASTKKHTEVELAEKLSLLGSQVSFHAGGRNSMIEVSSLTENLDATLAILQEKLFHPAFKDEEFQRIQLRALQQIQQSSKNPSSMMTQASRQLLYGEQNRMGVSDGGTTKSVTEMTIDDVKAFYRQYYSPDKANVVIVGNLSKEAVLEKLAFLSDWQNKPYSIPPYQDFPQWNHEPVIYVVDKPDATQSIVRLIKPFLPYDALGEQFRTNLMNFPLGGAFNSRINLNLREDKGYTYGARSRFVGGKTLGRFQAGGSMKADKTGAAITELLAEIDGFQAQGMTAQEQAFMRAAYTLGDALNYETPGKKAGFLLQLQTYGLSKDYIEQQNAIINQISLQELNALANQHLNSRTMQLIVVGDSKMLMPQLQAVSEQTGRKIVPLEVEL